VRWLKSNGDTLTVREVGPVELTLEPIDRARPLPILDVVEDDDAARERLRYLLRTGHYVKRG